MGTTFRRREMQLEEELLRAQGAATDRGRRGRGPRTVGESITKCIPISPKKNRKPESMRFSFLLFL